MLPSTFANARTNKPRQLSTPLSNIMDDYGRHSATLPRHCYDVTQALELEAKLRSQSSGPEAMFGSLAGRVKTRAGKMMSSRSPLGVDVAELSMGAHEDPRSMSKFSTFKASSKAIGARLKNILVPKSKLGALKQDEAMSRRGSLDYDTSNSSSNAGSNSTRNMSFSRSTLSRWNGSQASSGRRDSPLRQLFDPFDSVQWQSSDATESMPRPSTSSFVAHSVVTVPNGPNSFLNEAPPVPANHAQRSLGRMGGAKSLRALASFSRLRDASRGNKGNVSPPKLAVKRPIDEVGPSPTAIAFPTEAKQPPPNPSPRVRQHPASPVSSRYQYRSRTNSDARSSRRRVPSNASSHSRRRVPSRAPGPLLPPIADVKTFRISERDSWIHIEDAASSETETATAKPSATSQATPSTPLLQPQSEGPGAGPISPRLPTFSFTPPPATLLNGQHKLPALNLSPADSPQRAFHFSATPSSVLLPTGLSPAIPSFKVSTASDIVAPSQDAIGNKAQDSLARRLASQSHQNLQQRSTAPSSFQHGEPLSHQSSRDSLPCPPRWKRHRGATVSSQNSSITGAASSSDERSPRSDANAASTDNTMTSVRTISSSILYFGADLTPSRARPASMMIGSNADYRSEGVEATEVLRHKVEAVTLRPRTAASALQPTQPRQGQEGRPSMLPVPAPKQPLPPLPTNASQASNSSDSVRRAEHASHQGGPANKGKQIEQDADTKETEDIGDNTLTDTPGPDTLSRGICGTSSAAQRRTSGSHDSMASILSYVSTVVSSTESEDIQSLIDGVAADCDERSADSGRGAGRSLPLEPTAGGGQEPLRQVHSSDDSAVSSAYSNFELTTALAISNLPRLRIDKAATRASNETKTTAQAETTSDNSYSTTCVGDKTVGRAVSKIPVSLSAVPQGGETAGGTSLRESLTLRFPLPKPMTTGGAAHAGPSATSSSHHHHPPTSFSRHIQIGGSSNHRGAPVGASNYSQQGTGANGGGSAGLASNGQALKRTSNSGHSAHSHLSLVLAHLEESPCPPPRRRRAPKILGPSTQANV